MRNGRIRNALTTLFAASLVGLVQARAEGDTAVMESLADGVEAAAHEAYDAARTSYDIGRSDTAVGQVEAGELDVAIASWWGFDADDATDALQAAIDSGASTVVVPRMTEGDWIVEPIHLTQDDQTVLFEEGVVLRAKQGAFRGRNDSLVNIHDRENINLVGYGATLQMRKDDYLSMFDLEDNPHRENVDEPYRRAAFRMALELRGTRNVAVLGLTMNESGGDGIYIAGGNDRVAAENTLVRDVVCDNNLRQGISIISARNLLIERSVFANTRGSSPASGICIEPNNERQELVNVVIRNCIFDNNDFLNMHVFLGNLSGESEPVSVTWENNYSGGSEVGIHVSRIRDDGLEGSMIFRGNIVEGARHSGILARLVTADGGMDVRFEDNILRNVAPVEPEYDEQTLAFFEWRYPSLDAPEEWWRTPFRSAPIVLTAGGDSVVRQGNIHFENTLVIDAVDRPFMVIDPPDMEVGGLARDGGAELVRGDDGTEFETWANISGSIAVVNPYGARIDFASAVENMNLTVNARPARDSTD